MIDKISKVLAFVREYGSDCYRAVKHNYMSPLEDKDRRLFYRILITAHAIEKGLSLQNPRPLFGREKIKQLQRLIGDYNPEYNSLPLAMSIGALERYVDVHSKFQEDFVNELKSYVVEIKERTRVTSNGGIREVLSLAGDGSDGDGLSRRFSSRAFLQKPVEAELIEKLVGYASRVPSQCNRQSIRLHAYRNRDQIRRLLDLQGGSSGFSDQVPALFVVASELTAWGGPGQRSQAYVDGGLYSMGILLACHRHGLVSCPLNLAVTNKREREIRREAEIPEHQRLIMMIAFGHPIESTLIAARSARLGPMEIVSIHD